MYIYIYMILYIYISLIRDPQIAGLLSLIKATYVDIESYGCVDKLIESYEGHISEGLQVGVPIFPYERATFGYLISAAILYYFILC